MRLRAADIPARPRGPVPRNGPNRRGIPPPGHPWLPEVAYAVGLIATDGNLSRDGRHMTIVSVDRDLLETLRRCLAIGNRIGDRYNYGRPCYRLQWSDRTFYDALLRIGLHPAKSLTLGPLTIPDACFADFFRGCIDGDGSILTYTDRYHARKNPQYVYARLYVVLVSASRPFLEWIRIVVERIVGDAGSITTSKRANCRPVFKLRYAKHASVRLLHWMYYSPSVPCLARKRAAADAFLSPRECVIVGDGGVV